MDDILIELFLEFKNYDPPVLRKISEPVKFDGVNFTLKKDKGRIGRDVSYMGDEVSLMFHSGMYEKSEPHTLPDGSVRHYLDMGYEWIKECFENFGFESEISFLVSKDSELFTMGDLLIVEHDGFSFFECKVMQNSDEMKLKRQAETKIDLYSDKDVDGNDIEPLTPFNVLIKAKPVQQDSEWIPSSQQAQAVMTVIGDADDIVIKARAGGCNSNVVRKYGVEDTLSFISSKFALEPGFGDLYVPVDGNCFTFLQARSQINDVTVNITGVNVTAGLGTTAAGGVSCTRAKARFRFLLLIGSQHNNPRVVQVLHEVNFNFIDGVTDPADLTADFPTSFSVTIPSIFQGERMYIYIEPDVTDVEFTGIGAPGVNAFVTASATGSTGAITATGTATAFDSVVKMVWYRDMLRQVVSSASGMTIDARRWQEGNEFGMLAVTNSYGIRQITDKPFLTTFKDRLENLALFNADAQITPNTVYFGKYKDFFPNRRIAILKQLPDESNAVTFDEEAQINRFEIEFKTREQDREEVNTSEAIHTRAQFSVPNKMVQNVKKVEVEDVVDWFKWESTRKAAVNTERGNTRLDSDDKVYIAELIALEPGTTNTQTARLLQQTPDGEPNNLQILNGNIEQSGQFSWDLLGCAVGDSFVIEAGANAGTYTISEITPTVIKLTGSAPTTTADGLVAFTYPLTNVEYTNRTNEGITTSGISDANRYGNLTFNIKRLVVNYYGHYLATAMYFRQDKEVMVKEFVNALFKSTEPNGVEINDGVNYAQNSPISYAELPSPLLKPYIHKLKVAADFELTQSIVDGLNEITGGGVIGGYVTVKRPDGSQVNIFPIELSANWATNVLTITGKEQA